ncbi:MAG: TRAP transporter substrate-binding protein [Deferrisomatales bacterium]
MDRRFAGFLAVLASVAAFGGSPASAAPATLTYSNFFPPTHVHSKLAEAWCQEVEKRSGGQVAIQYFPGQTLTKADQIYDGVVNGISDIGYSLFAYTRGRFPVMEVVDLPLGYPSGKTATAVINEVFREMKPKELDDVKVLYLHAHGPGLVNSRTKPIRTMDDLKGLKFRATGFSAKMVQALGGTPVAMPMPETYQSLQKGVVDGATYPYEASKGFRLAEVTKFTTENYSMAYTSGFFVVMNKAKWEALPPAVQKAMEEVSAEWTGKTGEVWDEIDKEGKEFFLQQGGQSVSLSGEEAARWKTAVQPIQDEYLAAAAAKGVDGKKALDVTLRALEKHRGK